jgi:glucosamine-6-phosphate deaminase
MDVIISETKKELGQQAAAQGAELIRKAIAARGESHIIVATGASQFEMLDALVKEDINWSVVTAFHLDEYLGIPMTHPASFRKYLKERFADKVTLKMFHYINAEEDPEKECARLQQIIRKSTIDVAFVGIGENAHLAFNDPPADFETEKAYICVDLDEACRRQQLGEGWFTTLDEVPTRAISMSVKQILKAQAIICSVPDRRKAEAVISAVSGPVTPNIPSSVLQQHAATRIYLDRESASLLP